MKQIVGDLGEARATAHHRRHCVDGHVTGRGRDVGDNLLGHDIERVAQVPGGLDLAVDHPPGDHGRLQQIAAVLGEQLALARLAHLVAGTADALQTAADRARRLHLDDEVDGAHVDAQLQAAGGDDGAQLTPLQLVLDHDALLSGERTVMGLDEVLGPPAGLRIHADAGFLCGLVQSRREPLGLAAGVAKDDRAAMGQHQSEDAWVDAGPDARPLRVHRRAGGPGPQLTRRQRLTHLAHVFHRDDDFDLELLADAGVDDGDRPRATGLAVAAEEAGDLLERALGGGQADALRRGGGDLLEPFQRHHQVRTALGGGHRVDLVDDHGLDAGQRGRGRRGEHEVQALRRGDEEVRRTPDQGLAILRAGVAGAHGHHRFDERLAESLCGEFDAHQRGAQVLLDIEGEGTQRRDVQHARAGSLVRHG